MCSHGLHASNPCSDSEPDCKFAIRFRVSCCWIERPEGVISRWVASQHRQVPISTLAAHHARRTSHAAHRTPPTAHRTPHTTHRSSITTDSAGRRSAPPTALCALGLPCTRRVPWRSLPTPRYGMLDPPPLHCRAPTRFTSPSPSRFSHPTALAPSSAAQGALRLRDLLRVVCRPPAADEWVPSLGA